MSRVFVFALLDDLLFRSKLEAAAAPLKTTLLCASETRVLPALPEGGRFALVIVDLGLSGEDPFHAIQHLRAAWPATPIVAFGSHVDTEALARAQRAGCLVLPRSAFVQRLPSLLSGGGLSGV